MKPITPDTVCRIPGELRLCGIADSTVRFLTENTLCDREMWRRFVDQYRCFSDTKNNGWRGEYWGKMMRGAAWIYRYSKDEALYAVLTETVSDMLTVEDGEGRVSTFAVEREFRAWDIWCRKYVMLGLIFYCEICTDELLKSQILAFVSRMADYILAHIGDGEGKTPINLASTAWYGLNSSSLLEPIVRLYSLTGKAEYLAFAEYIIAEGGCTVANIFSLAEKNELYPYQYGVSKAYEMISCFEGIVAYYRVSGNEKYKQIAINFGYAVKETEISVIGSSGCTHELFDFTRARQTVPYDGPQQETCVTVTWMKYCAEMLRLTADFTFADCMEQSFYNAYLGALNTLHCESEFIERVIVPKVGQPVNSTFLPFDSYSPLLPGIRGHIAVGGCQVLPDSTYYGCCACIGAAGVGVFLDHALLSDRDGLVLNFFENGTYKTTVSDTEISLTLRTDYPLSGSIAISVETSAPIDTAIKIRIPAWSEKTTVKATVPYEIKDGCLVMKSLWQGGESVLLELDMSVRVTRPVKWDTELIYNGPATDPRWYAASAQTVIHDDKDDRYISLSYGPLTLAADAALGRNPKLPVDIVGEDGALSYTVASPVPLSERETPMLRLEFASAKEGKISLIDYASAGRAWDRPIAAWLPVL